MDEALDGHQHGRHGLLGEAEGAGEAVVLVGGDHALAARLLDQGRDLLAGVARADLVLGLDPHEAQDAVGREVEQQDDRAQHGDDDHHRRTEHEGGPGGTGERDVLGHHLPQHDVQVDDDRHGDDEGHRVQRGVRHPHRVEHGLEQVGHGGLADGAEAQRAHGDAELGAGHHERDLLHRAQRGAPGPGPGLGQRLDLAAARRQQGELRAHEEGVEGQQHDGDHDSGEVTHGRAPPPSARPGPVVGPLRRGSRAAARDGRCAGRPSARR